jgi:HAD superfamily hydrolase (TIGR01549 family)
MIASILFDLYETLITEREAPSTRASALGERLGLDAAAYRSSWKRQRPRVVRGETSLSGALVNAGVELGRRVDLEVVRDVCVERCQEKAALFHRFDPGAVAAIRELRSRGIRLAVVSNCFAEDVTAWATCAVAEYFDVSAFSFQIGAAKPESRIYRYATQRLGVDPVDALYIGDGGDDELAGAERAGLRAAQAAWFRGEVADLPARIPRLASWQSVLAFVAAG